MKECCERSEYSHGFAQLQHVVQMCDKLKMFPSFLKCSYLTLFSFGCRFSTKYWMSQTCIVCGKGMLFGLKCKNCKYVSRLAVGISVICCNSSSVSDHTYSLVSLSFFYKSCVLSCYFFVLIYFLFVFPCNMKPLFFSHLN